MKVPEDRIEITQPILFHLDAEIEGQKDLTLPIWMS
jgi:hypothetical protein